jgi:hypothetical protein
MTTQNDGGTAFPILERGGNGLELTSLGISARDYFAAKALQGMLCNGWVPSEIRPEGSVLQKLNYGELAYKLADQMIEARK